MLSRALRSYEWQMRASPEPLPLLFYTPTIIAEGAPTIICLGPIDKGSPIILRRPYYSKAGQNRIEGKASQL